MENRRFQRFIVEGMEIQCKILFASEVGLNNISLGGASLFVDRKLIIGGEYNLKMEYQDDTVCMKGTVVWEKMAGLRKNECGEMVPRYEVGIKFSDVITEKGNYLMNFICDHFPGYNVRRRIGGMRVKIADPEHSAVEGFLEGYTVKIISEGGMLIETSQALPVEGRYRMDICLPEETVPVRLVGRVVYCTELPGSLPARFDVGIEFLDVDMKDKERLGELIHILQSL